MTTTTNDGTDRPNPTTLYAETLTHLPLPTQFYKEYVKKRRPVLLKGCCDQVTPKLLAAVASLEKLVNSIGKDTMVQVNQRNHNNSKNNVFSPMHSRVVEMSFGDFVQHLLQTNNNHGSCCDYYMTTQTLSINEEGQPLLYTSPITQLVQSNNMDTLKPCLLGNLVLMTCNLWMGQTSQPLSTSSGLHHDYHDNLYCLLEGKKQFRIAPPSSVFQLKMKGTLHTLHDNGRIVYQEQVQDDADGIGDMIRPDGALESVERIMTLEIRKEGIEQALENITDESKRQELEEEMDVIEEELLDLEMDNHANDDDDSENESDSNSEPSPKRTRTSSTCSSDDDDVPLNFVLEENDSVHFQTVEMTKGDLLYLPAGWFHQVSSKGEAGKNGLHIAFNYWVHPPDVGEEVSFQEPYRSKFWQRDWESRPESKQYESSVLETK